MRQKWCIFVLLLLGCCFTRFPAYGYESPRRTIVVSPYIQMLSARKFSVFSHPPSRLEKDRGFGVVKDQIGFGIGINVSTQLLGQWSYFFDYAVGPLQVKYSDVDLVGIFVLGVSYSFDALRGKTIIDVGYGVSHWGKWAEMILKPSLGYSKHLTERSAVFVNVGYPIVNDWFINAGVEEHYTSFSFSTGINVFF